MMTACLDEPDCVREASNDIKFLFKNSADGKNRTVIIDSVVVFGADSILYRAKSTSTAVIELDPLHDFTSIVFHSNLAVDTIILEYRTFTRLITPDCGPETFILDLSIREHTFDSLRFINRNVLPNEDINIEVYY